MNCVLVRPTRSTWREDLARLALVSALLTAGGIGWHVLRPHLIGAVARSSVGCAARSELLAHVLSGAHPGQFQDAYRCWSTYGRRARLVECYSRVGSEDKVSFADHALDPIGSVTCLHVSGYADDMDGDGRIELAAWLAAWPPRYPTGVIWSAAVRLGRQDNQVLGLLMYPQQGSPALRDAWRDEDGDGLVELVLLAVPIPGKTTSTQPSPTQAAAVFEWTAPGGILRPRYMPADGSVTFWSPPDGQPLPLASDESLNSVLDRVLAEFSPPGSAPSSSPAP